MSNICFLQTLPFFSIPNHLSDIIDSSLWSSNTSLCLFGLPEFSIMGSTIWIISHDMADPSPLLVGNAIHNIHYPGLFSCSIILYSVKIISKMTYFMARCASLSWSATCPPCYSHGFQTICNYWQSTAFICFCLKVFSYLWIYGSIHWMLPLPDEFYIWFCDPRFQWWYCPQ